MTFGFQESSAGSSLSALLSFSVLHRSRHSWASRYLCDGGCDRLYPEAVAMMLTNALRHWVYVCCIFSNKYAHLTRDAPLLRRVVDSSCKRRLRVGAACLRSDRRCGRRSFLESSVTTKAQALHDDPEPNRPRREWRRCAVVYSALRTLERISRLAYLSFSFCGWHFRNCKRRLIFSNRKRR